jgi:hypothetical protein
MSSRIEWETWGGPIAAVAIAVVGAAALLAVLTLAVSLVGKKLPWVRELWRRARNAGVATSVVVAVWIALAVPLFAWAGSQGSVLPVVFAIASALTWVAGGRAAALWLRSKAPRPTGTHGTGSGPDRIAVLVCVCDDLDAAAIIRSSHQDIPVDVVLLDPPPADRHFHLGDPAGEPGTRTTDPHARNAGSRKLFRPFDCIAHRVGRRLHIRDVAALDPLRRAVTGAEHDHLVRLGQTGDHCGNAK